MLQLCHVCEIHTRALNPHTHSAAFVSPQVIYFKKKKKSALLLPQMSNWTLSPPERVTALLASRDEKPRPERSGPSGVGGVVSGYYDGGGIRLQLVSFQPDVPVLQFTFLCCVVILATLISVLHFILTSKGNMLVKFHWISGPFSGPPRLVCAFWHLPSTLASAAVHERTVTFKNIAEPQRPV